MKIAKIIPAAIAACLSFGVSAQNDLLGYSSMPSMGASLPVYWGACGSPGAGGVTSSGVQVTCTGGLWARLVATSPAIVAAGQSCTAFGRGNFAFDSTGQFDAQGVSASEDGYVDDVGRETA